jgi:hypothetical protein
MAEMQARAEGLDAAADRLRQLVLLHDPRQLIPSIAVPISMGPYDPSAPDDAEATYSRDAKVEYLVGLALSGEPGSEPVVMATTYEAIRLTAEVFDAAHARMFIDSIAETHTDRLGIDEASFLLRVERLEDRMAGYAVHLEEIDSEVFDKHRSYVGQLGAGGMSSA